MLLIWGFRVRLNLGEAVAFFCPTCGGDRAGRRGVARRWFTFFWIPLIPLKVVGELVQCDTCATQFDAGVLDRPTTSALGQVLSNAVRVLTAMIVRSGDAEQPAMRGAAVASVRSVVDGYDDATLSSDLLAVDTSLAEQYVHPLADGLEVAGKERVVADLTRVAMAGGTVTDDQRRLLEATGRGLGLTPAHITGIVSSVVSASTPAPPPAPSDPAPPG